MYILASANAGKHGHARYELICTMWFLIAKCLSLMLLILQCVFSVGRVWLQPPSCLGMGCDHLTCLLSIYCYELSHPTISWLPMRLRALQLIVFFHATCATQLRNSLHVSNWIEMLNLITCRNQCLNMGYQNGHWRLKVKGTVGNGRCAHHPKSNFEVIIVFMCS